MRPLPRRRPYSRLAGEQAPMSVEDVTRDLFDRWERVWHNGEFELISSCVAPTYIRHDHLGDRTVTSDSYEA
jgi:hypothetical protein